MKINNCDVSVGPRGVSSGVSFRILPKPSLQSIADICTHYKEKNIGQYESLASRYLVQMSTEIMTQVLSLSNSAKEDEELFCEMKNTLNEWNEKFSKVGLNSKECQKHNINKASCIKPIDIMRELRSKDNQIENLRRKNDELIMNAERVRYEVATEFDDQIIKYKESIEYNQEIYRKEVEKLKGEICQLKTALTQIKKDACAELSFTQMKAEEAINQSEVKRKADIDKLVQKNAASEDQKRLQFDKERFQLVRKIKEIEEREQKSLANLKRTMNKAHSIEISALKRDLAIISSKLKVEESRRKILASNLNDRTCKSTPTIQKYHTKNERASHHHERIPQSHKPSSCCACFCGLAYHHNFNQNFSSPHSNVDVTEHDSLMRKYLSDMDQVQNEHQSQWNFGDLKKSDKRSNFLGTRSYKGHPRGASTFFDIHRQKLPKKPKD